MKQLALLLCVVAYVAGGSNKVNEANDFIDVVLLQRMPMLIRDTPGLYPTAPLPPFTFKVYKTAITNRDLKVNVTRGGIKNFDTAVRRVGDCDPKVVAGNTSVTCVISFDGIASDMVAVTKGDNLLGTIKDVGVQAVVYNTTGTMEVTAARNRPGFVRTFFVEHVKLEVTPGDNLDLNAVRMSNFKSYIANYLREELYLNLYGNYQTLLNYAVATMNFSML
uniref:Salivary secreted protein n=1 Tax=Amblyomma maculatum TaxID=34609 RepID=G3MRY7_AMBMU